MAAATPSRSRTLLLMNAMSFGREGSAQMSSRRTPSPLSRSRRAVRLPIKPEPPVIRCFISTLRAGPTTLRYSTKSCLYGVACITMGDSHHRTLRIDHRGSAKTRCVGNKKVIRAMNTTIGISGDACCIFSHRKRLKKVTGGRAGIRLVERVGQHWQFLGRAKRGIACDARENGRGACGKKCFDQSLESFHKLGMLDIAPPDSHKRIAETGKEIGRAHV